MTTTKPDRPTGKAAALSPVLRTVTVDDAVEALTALDRAGHVIPDAGRDQITETLTAVRRTATALGLTNVHELATHASAVLRAACGVAQVTAFHKSAVAGPLHRTRNVLAALVVAAATDIGADADAVRAAVPVLRTRTVHLLRPLEHDEILLCRIDMWRTANGGPDGLRAASTYALCEVGVTPGETTTIALDSFDDVREPATVLAPGNRNIELRLLVLDEFAAPILRTLTHTATDCGASARRPLTYRPRVNQPGSGAATASAQGIIDRLLKRWGLFADDVTAYSLPLWRVATTHQRDGVTAATAISGRTADRTRALLNIRPSASPLRTPAVTSFDLTT